jgi:hypothetical protein
VTAYIDPIDAPVGTFLSIVLPHETGVLRLRPRDTVVKANNITFHDGSIRVLAAVKRGLIIPQRVLPLCMMLAEQAEDEHFALRHRDVLDVPRKVARDLRDRGFVPVVAAGLRMGYEVLLSDTDPFMGDAVHGTERTVTVHSVTDNDGLVTVYHSDGATDADDGDTVWVKVP